MDDYIKSVDDYQKLFGALLEEDKNKMSVAQFASGIEIIHENTRADYVYFIVNGICGIFKELENGENFCYYKISKGDVIGLSEVLEENALRYARIISLTDVTAMKIRKDDLTEWMVRYPRFYNQLVGGIIRRLHETLSKHVECKKYDAKTNVVSYLIYSYELYKRSYESDYEGYVKINETREMISDFIGMSRRSVNHAIEILKNDSLIRIEHGKIFVSSAQYEALVTYKSECLL